jgi:hypothetical protein
MNMRSARHVIAVTLMASAICADRSIAAAPTEPQAATLAGRIIERLSVKLRNVIPATRLYQPRRFGLGAARAALPRFSLVRTDFTAPQLSPFQFRLPPPSA